MIRFLAPMLVLFVPGLIAPDEGKKEEKPLKTLTIEEAEKEIAKDSRLMEAEIKNVEGNRIKQKEIMRRFYKKWEGTEVRVTIVIHTIDEHGNRLFVSGSRGKHDSATYIFLGVSDKKKIVQMSRGDKLTFKAQLHAVDNNGPPLACSLDINNCRVVAEPKK